MTMPEEKPALRAIRQKCLDCSGDSPQEVELCSLETCPLYPFRRGTLPDAAGGAGGRGKQRNPLELSLPGLSTVYK